MSDTDPGRDPLDEALTSALRARAATNVLPEDGLGQIHLEVARRRRRRRATWLAAAAVFLVLVGVAGVAARSARNDSSPYVGPDVTTPVAPDTTPVTPTISGPGRVSDRQCAGYTPISPPALDGNVGGASLEEVVRTLWPRLAGGLPLLRLSPSAYPCSVDVETPVGSFTTSGFEDADGLWYLDYVRPIEWGDEMGLSVGWADGKVSVGSTWACAGCVSAELTVVSNAGSTVERSGIPLVLTLDVPGADTNRALLIRYFDADGALRSVRLTSIPSGDFAAS